MSLTSGDFGRRIDGSRRPSLASTRARAVSRSYTVVFVGDKPTIGDYGASKAAPVRGSTYVDIVSSRRRDVTEPTCRLRGGGWQRDTMKSRRWRRCLAPTVGMSAKRDGEKQVYAPIVRFPRSNLEGHERGGCVLGRHAFNASNAVIVETACVHVVSTYLRNRIACTCW